MAGLWQSQLQSVPLSCLLPCLVLCFQDMKQQLLLLLREQQQKVALLCFPFPSLLFFGKRIKKSGGRGGNRERERERVVTRIVFNFVSFCFNEIVANLRALFMLGYPFSAIQIPLLQTWNITFLFSVFACRVNKSASSNVDRNSFLLNLSAKNPASRENCAINEGGLPKALIWRPSYVIMSNS